MRREPTLFPPTVTSCFPVLILLWSESDGHIGSCPGSHSELDLLGIGNRSPVHLDAVQFRKVVILVGPLADLIRSEGQIAAGVAGS